MNIGDHQTGRWPLSVVRRSKGGFTLIELLVVVAVIAILAALLLPVLARARYSAKCACCLSNHRQVLIGLTNYASEYDGWYPARYPVNSSYDPCYWSEYATGMWDLHQAAEDYLGAPMTLFCPVSYPRPPVPWKPFTDSYGKIFYCSSMEVWAGFDGAHALGENPTVPLSEFPKRVMDAKEYRPLTGDSIRDESAGGWGALWGAPHHWLDSYQKGKGPGLPLDLKNPYGYADGSVRTTSQFEIFEHPWFGYFYWATPER